MKLYVRDEIVEIKALVLELMNTLHSLMKEHIHTYMPGFTHLQKAQPITLAHHFGAYMEMFKRDYGRLCDIYARMNYCPLGSGALAGTTYPLDRELTASLLDFAGPTLNSMDSVADRDYCIELFPLCDIRVFFLWHDRASCAVCVIQFDKLIFICIPDNDLLWIVS